MTETQNSTVEKKRADCLEWEDVKIDNKSRRAYCCLKEIFVSPREYRILEFLIKNPGTVFSRDEIIASVWGKKTCIGSRTIDVYIRRLRKALKSDKSCRFGIRTARSFGYSIDYVE
ncbi:MAG: winged helix-turn-helix domain-containing protein [Pseudomonadota bacterium]|nr:winged helix-turn-helix domain-containing protein [Pseudomonadota bacterium]